MAQLERSITIQAKPEEVYALVSDLPRMGEWSPECARVTWKSGATGPALGARFIGHNRVGKAQWFTQGVVTKADPARHFAFAIRFGPVPVALWEYTLTPSPGLNCPAADANSPALPSDGCVLTESWTDRRPAPLRLFMDRLFGPRTRINARGIERTLAALKTTAESPTPT
ncbi:SRPBCC family protein [Kribbella deserti]|uniref:SRPBCC family protein n=1 Tax=Kribbella deserti TaxID=1926257 RepID=A0ABV6QDF7_9ACTN